MGPAHRSAGLTVILKAFSGDNRGSHKATWVSDSALLHCFSSALFCKVYSKEILFLWEVNKSSGKHRLHELVFWEILKLPREVNQLVFCFSRTDHLWDFNVHLVSKRCSPSLHFKHSSQTPRGKGTLTKRTSWDSNSQDTGGKTSCVDSGV